MIEWLGQVTLRSPQRRAPGLREPPAHYRFALVRVLRDCRELVAWGEGPRTMTRAQAEQRFAAIIPNVSVVQEPGEGLELRMVRGNVVARTHVFIGRPPGCGTVAGIDDGEVIDVAEDIAALGQVTLRSPSRLPGLFQFRPPGVTLREPPGQWSFEIRVGVKSFGTCGPPFRMTTDEARASASTLYNLVRAPLTAPLFQNCPDVISRARDAYLGYQRAGRTALVEVRASRNGVYKFTYPASQIGTSAGVLEEGMLGQALSAPGAPVVPGEPNFDLFTMQVLVNEVLRVNNLPEIRADGILDRATCDRLLQIARGAFGAIDQQLSDLVLAHQEVSDFCRSPTPLPQPPPPEEVPPNPYEQCVVGFGDVSDAVRSLQRRINAELQARGYVPIPEDGAWNSVTCGAFYFLTISQNVSVEAGVEGSLFNIPECPGVMTVPSDCPDRVVPQRAGAPAAAKGGGGVALALLAAVALAGAYYISQS